MPAIGRSTERAIKTPVFKEDAPHIRALLSDLLSTCLQESVSSIS
jgi:hypothetical protein